MLLCGIATTFYNGISRTPGDVSLPAVKKKCDPVFKEPLSSKRGNCAPSPLGVVLTNEVKTVFLSETKSTAESVKMPAVCICVKG